MTAIGISDLLVDGRGEFVLVTVEHPDPSGFLLDDPDDDEVIAPDEAFRWSEPRVEGNRLVVPFTTIYS